MSVSFKSIFNHFQEKKKDLKVISVASCTKKAEPNSASKMLVEVTDPNLLYFLDYKTTQSFHNISENPLVSVSFMDDAHFTGYRLTGTCKILESGAEYDEISKSWDKRLIGYEAERIVQRISGRFSTREAEGHLPKNFVIVRLEARDGSVVKPGRIFRAAATETEDDKT